MHAQTWLRLRHADLLIPLSLLLAFGTAIAWQLDLPTLSAQPGLKGPTTVVVAAHTFRHRLPGDYLQSGVPVNGPMLTEAGGQIEVMKHQVTVEDYLRCVEAGHCEPARPAVRGEGPDTPVTGVSFDQAMAYADWLSEGTGDVWRLPTVEEWIFFAAERAVDHALEAATSADNPADRWIAYYEQEAARKVEVSAAPHTVGAFGANSLDVEDLAGNVWEWTSTCTNRTTLDASGAETARVENCGVRYLEGRHLTPMSVFVQDARGGGCSVGAPPDNLGFRLVREPGWLEAALAHLPRL